MSSNVAIARPRVVIIGAGFGGLSAAKALGKAPFDVALIDRHNYHMFQPLLYQVATAALSPDDIAFPIRTVFRRKRNVSVMLANVSAIDAERNEVIAEGDRIPFDYLIVATGARQAYFGHNDWAQHAPGLKTIGDAVYLRNRILLAFEKAETEPDPNERRRLLNFVVVGGGATGVELTGAIAELAKRTLASDFRTIDPSSARIVLIEAASRLLRQFDESLSSSAQRALERLGAEVRLGTLVTGCDEAGISMGTERIESRTIVWSAGVEASPARTVSEASHRPGGRGQGRAGPLSVRASTYLRAGRYGACHWCRGGAASRRRSGRQATRRLCRSRDCRARRWATRRPVSIPGLRHAGDHRKEPRGGAIWARQTQWLSGVGALVLRTHLFSHRIQKPPHRNAELGVELPRLPARGATHHRNGRGADGGN